MTYEQIGGKLTVSHPRLMVNVERRLCKCRENSSYKIIRGSYPVCVYKIFRKYGHKDGRLLRNEKTEDILEKFWELEVKEVQKKHPEWVMEIYMVG